MSQVELIWGAFSLMILGALVSMCMKCQRAGNRQKEPSLDRLQNECENHQRCEGACSCSASGQECDKMPYNLLAPSQRSIRPSLAHQLDACVESRYQNLGKEPQIEKDATYVQPICTEQYYNCGKFLRHPSDEDAHSYQNVDGLPQRSGCALAEADVYENTTTIQIWKHSQGAANSSDDDDDESDYINADPNCRPAA